jgi:hypothetical protein
MSRQMALAPRFDWILDANNSLINLIRRNIALAALE